MQTTITTARSATSRKAIISGLMSSAIPAVVLLSPAAAFAGTAVNTATVSAPSGTFEVNTANNSATDTDNVLAVIVAANDSATGINGLAGATAVVNAFTSDTINGVAASPSNAVLSVASGSSVPAGLTFDTATGNVSVAAGTPAGTYSFDYQICEALNPTNCQTATITVTVEAAAIAADGDTASGINGAAGAPNVVNVLDGDTLNGTQVTLADVDLSVTTPATPASPGAPVPSLDPATGQVSVPAGTPAGTYTITYQICEKLNPTNCATNTVSVTVDAATIVAANDSATGINGLAGATAVVNAFTSDTINGVAASPSNAVLSVASGSSVPAGLTFDTATGNVSVAAGTPAGTYSFDYQICEALNPTNCQTATITVTVEAAAIAADGDTASGINGAAGAPNVVNVLDGDTLNGTQVTLADVDLSVTTPATPASPGAPVPSLDPATGQVSVPAGTPAGTYTITYQICEKLNPTNCATNTVSVTVDAATIVAANDSATGVNGLAGATAVVNAFTSDTINGVAASPSNAVLSVASGSSVPAGLTFDTATGNVSVAAGTPAGTYSFDYQICEALNPTNCQTATITVTVEAAAIAADGDTASGINGAAGAPNVVNVLDGDTLNGTQVTLADVDLSVTTPATPASPGAPVPSLDPATGQVSVPAGTPAGTYTITYQICEKLNPTNCATNTATITVEASSITADDESVTGINGLAGQAGVLDVIAGDTLNGTQVSLGAVDLSVVTPATPVDGGPVPTLNTATGLVDVPAGTPAGTYSIVYQICEKLNPTNCATATARVTVAPSIDLEISKTDGKTDVFSGETVTYSLTITNLGPDTATGAVVKDVPGAGLTCAATNALTFSGAGIPAGSFTIGDLVGSGVTLGSLAKNQSITITYSCTVN